jgi:small subunit ribosomal protein S21
VGGRGARATHEDTPIPATPIVNDHVPVLGRPLEVKVDDRGVERAIRKLRRIMASEGVLREIKRRRHHEKPSIKLKRKEREAERRRKRRQRKTRMPAPAPREKTGPGME